MDVHSLVDMNGHEVIEARASPWSKGGIRLRRFGDEALHRFNVLMALVLGQGTPTEQAALALAHNIPGSGRDVPPDYLPFLGDRIRQYLPR